jgi:fructosamine-3-kinase
MDKKTLIHLFIKHFNEFIEDIESVFPEDQEISVLKDFLSLYSMVNKTALIDIWTSYVSDAYREEIKEKNFNFFIDKDWDHDLRYASNKTIITEKLSHIKDCVREMDEDNKTKALKYVENLIKISDLYNQNKSK